MKSELLEDVLKEGDFAGFREELLERTLAETRRRRFAAGPALLALAAAIALVAGVLWMVRPAPQVVTKVEPLEVVPLLRRIPLQASQVLETRAMPEMMFATDHSVTMPSISDRELLALFPKRPVGLAGKRFFFLNARDTKEFMSSN